MHIINIKKRSGGTRTIYAPSKKERVEYRTLLSTIAQPPTSLKSAHGFMSGRNIVTNARPHAGKAMTVSMDLSNFFDTVKPSMVRGRVPGEVLEKCFLDAEGNPGATDECRARQGLPTSPAIANLAAAPMDEAIRKRLTKLAIAGAVYTRYADDLSVSCDMDDERTARLIIEEVTQIIKRSGFLVNPRKTRVKRASGGNRECCGIMATPEGVAISRRTKRTLRAATHNLAVARESGADEKAIKALARKYYGLREFSKLKEPRTLTEKDRLNETRMREVAELARELGLRAPKDVIKAIPDEDLGNGVHITTDPVMMYGMSAYTTGWTSCMAIVGSHSYNYHRGVPFWQRLSGVSLAYLNSGSTKTIAGVTRPKMSARALVYQLRDGRRCHGDIYSGGEHTLWPTTEPGKKLQSILESAGFLNADDCSGGLVEGSVVQPCPLPYFDNTNVETVTLSETKRKAFRVRVK